MKKQLILILLITISNQVLFAQNNLYVEGNGLFTSPSSTNVDIKNIDSSTNALVRFGDNNTLKSSLGFNGNDEAFKISMSNTLGREDFSMSLNGRIGINSLPDEHRLSIFHNSTSGVDGSAHLLLREQGAQDYSRLRFENDGDNGFWTIASRATDGSSLMNFFYNDGMNFANILSLEGDLFRVGIHQTEPDAFLHIKQNTAGVDALKFENDESTGGEIWGFRVGDNDILLYFEGDLRGSFNSDDGVYTNFPPSPLTSGQKYLRLEDGTIDKIKALVPRKRVNYQSNRSSLNFDPNEVEKIDPTWVVRSEDGERINVNYQQFSVIAIKAIQEQQSIIESQSKKMENLLSQNIELDQRIKILEEHMKGNQKSSN